MHFFRRRLLNLVRMACWLILAAALMPTVMRALVASDPLRAVAWTEICTSGGATIRVALADTSTGGGAELAAEHCPLCMTAGLPASWPEPDRRADFAPAPHHLRPVFESLKPPRPAPVWRLEPSRAPPSFA